MATSVSHEELMKSHDHVVWDLNGTEFTDQTLTKKSCQSIWEILNSKITNLIIVFLTLIDCIVLLTTLLIDLNIIRDPHWPQTCNESTTNVSTVIHTGDTTSITNSPLYIVRNILHFTNIVILSIFVLEVLLRVLSGRIHFFRQCIELFDATIVLVAFALGLAFLSAPKDGRVSAVLFVIVLRLWRIKRVSQCIKQDAKNQMAHLLNAYKRDNVQAEHKVELLILQVEDLEHEIAYLKEKLKKTERDAACKKTRSKDCSKYVTTHARNCDHQARHCQNDLPLMQRPQPEGRTESPPIDQDAVDLYHFAETTVRSILRTASNELSNKDKWQKLRTRDDEQQPSVAAQFQQFQNKVAKRAEKPCCKNGPMSSAEELDELSEIERIRNVHFDPTRKQKNIPITTL